ncbi:unnamed protein product [Schistosoma curassoni]|uniref:Reverse transcriptase domain-containing protein n=1 Tax=Schistosoma curassoni TaxID=6186 RepID=A0A183KHA4_9TREM|nr:unnamed protein product [Schistosoma curassoni]
MERSNNVGNRQDQSNGNGNEEIQHGSTGNQRNPLDPSWTEKAKYGRDAAILRTMEDVRTKRVADVASDHHLVVANLKLKLKKNWTTGQTALQRLNTNFLRDTDKLNEFKITLNNRFHAFQDLLSEEETSMEDNWKGIKEALTSTCQEVLGLKKHHHKE